MSVEIPTVKSCCCFSLRTGCLVIGFLTLMANLLYFLDITVISITLHVLHKYSSSSIFVTLINTLSFNITLSFEIIFSVYLIYGTLKDKPFLLLSWLICMVASVITSIISLIFHMQNSYYFDWRMVIETLMIMGVQIFFSLVVFSHYLKMGKNSESNVQQLMNDEY